MSQRIPIQPLQHGSFYTEDALMNLRTAIDTQRFYKLVREKRNDLLKRSDWTVSLDSPLSDIKKQQWVEYRQALRDVPQNIEPDINIVWPTKPN